VRALRPGVALQRTYVRVDLDLELGASALLAQAGKDLARLLGLVDRHHRVLVADADEGRPGDGLELGRDRETRLEWRRAAGQHGGGSNGRRTGGLTNRVEGDGGVSERRLARGGEDRVPSTEAEADGDERLGLGLGPDGLEEVLPDWKRHCGRVDREGTAG
jgi:hypothetical protein